MQEMVLFKYLLGPGGEGEEWRTREQCVDRLYQGTQEPANALVCLSYYKRRLSMKLKPLGLTIEMMYGYGYFLTGVARR